MLPKFAVFAHFPTEFHLAFTDFVHFVHFSSLTGIYFDITNQNIPVGVITEKDIAKKLSIGTKPIKSVKAKDFKPRELFTLLERGFSWKMCKINEKTQNQFGNNT